VVKDQEKRPTEKRLVLLKVLFILFVRLSLR
ncbi:MAG: hypothetical protein ACI976_002699, partial [Aureispira sp.]